MSTTPHHAPARGSAPSSPKKLGGVTGYDRAAGLLVSLLLLLGATAGVLLFVWLGSKFVVRTKTVPVVVQPEKPGGSSDGVSSEGVTLDAPTVQELQQASQIALPEFRSTSAALDELLAERGTELAASLEGLDAPSAGGGRATGSGTDAAFGAGEGAGGLPRSQRWEIRFASGDTLAEYRRELDFFGIELAAVAADGRVEYVRRFAQKTPTVDRERSAAETRLYMQWRRGSSRLDADRKLLESAGVVTTEKTPVQFIPPELERRLAELEREFAGREAKNIRKTRFASRPADRGFEFFVEEQIPL